MGGDAAWYVRRRPGGTRRACAPAFPSHILPPHGDQTSGPPPASTRPAHRLHGGVARRRGKSTAEGGETPRPRNRQPTPPRRCSHCSHWPPRCAPTHSVLQAGPRDRRGEKVGLHQAAVSSASSRVPRGGGPSVHLFTATFTRRKFSPCACRRQSSSARVSAPQVAQASLSSHVVRWMP